MEITEDDVEEAKEIARNVSIPQQNVFLHSVTRQYIVDGVEGVRQPIGREGRMLEADYHIIHGIRGRIQNAIRCVREIPLEVEDVVFNPVAAAQVVLTREAKTQGALMLDFGAGTCDYVLYDDGMITASGCVPLGGDHITNDVAMALRDPKRPCREAQSRRRQHRLSRRHPDEMLHRRRDRPRARRGARAFLNEVMYLRTKEIMETVKAAV
jgi:cell division protein FtsA